MAKRGRAGPLPWRAVTGLKLQGLHFPSMPQRTGSPGNGLYAPVRRHWPISARRPRPARKSHPAAGSGIAVTVNASTVGVTQVCIPVSSTLCGRLAGFNLVIPMRARSRGPHGRRLNKIGAGFQLPFPGFGVIAAGRRRHSLTAIPDTIKPSATSACVESCSPNNVVPSMTT